MRIPFSQRYRHTRTPIPGIACIVLAAVACLMAGQDARAATRQMLRGHVPAVVSRLTPVKRLAETQRMNLAIALPVRNPQGLSALLRKLYDPTDPNYRHWLTPAQFAAQFGPTQADYEAVTSFAKAHNLTVTRRYGNRLVLDVNGAVADIEKTLHVTMRVYQHPTEARTFYAPDSEPSLDLAIPISHIGGLDNYARPRPHSEIMPANAPKPLGANTGSGVEGFYVGRDFRAAYAPSVSQYGSGQKVALLQFDGYEASDISLFESYAGEPNVPLTTVLLDGYDGTPASTDGQLEVSLDIQMAISMAPSASGIIVYEAGPDGIWDDILSQIASDDFAKQVSCSWSEEGATDDPEADGYFAEMASQGQSFFCASGDSDAYTGMLPFPQDNPYITEVGGTTLTVTGTGGPWSSETVWNWGGGTGSSGGTSEQYPIPVWQTATSMMTNGGSTTMRNTPDVALVGDNVLVVMGGLGYGVGGTSCAAPLWAGFTALINQKALYSKRPVVGFINPSVYRLASSSGYAAAFHDITTGNNTSPTSPNQFYAVSGYDLCTGLGTPTGAATINALALAPDNLALSFGSLLSSGTAGVGFSPNSATFTLVNNGTSSLSWTARATQPWLSLSATNGTLAASGSTTVTASINANANVLGTGTDTDTISFTDVATNFIQTRPVTLGVVATPVITSSTNVTATQGQLFLYQIAGSNVPASYSATGFPAGFNVNQSTGLVTGTWESSGSNTVTINATNAAGTGSALLSVLVQTPFAAWENAVFSPSALTNPTVSGVSASPAGDGIPNLIKYALNLNPYANGTSGLPVSAIATTGSGNYLTLSYTQVIAATDITYTVQVSTDMQNWYSGSGYTTQVSAVNNPGGITQTVTVQAVTPITLTAPRQFIRLKVTEQ